MPAKERNKKEKPDKEPKKDIKEEPKPDQKDEAPKDDKKDVKAEGQPKKKEENTPAEEKAIEPEVVEEITKDKKLIGALVHILGLCTHIIGPLLIYLIKKNESEFVGENARRALNFQLTMVIFYCIGIFTIWAFFLGLLIIFMVIIFELVFCIQAAMAANNGNTYKYPISFQFIK